jgi:hypothetical protein
MTAFLFSTTEKISCFFSPYLRRELNLGLAALSGFPRRWGGKKTVDIN